ncbi:MAG: hypothetical protein JWR20_1887 [Marmoricola sp.]|nr:hypothetical protein [Marmoricola sp.]
MTHEDTTTSRQSRTTPASSDPTREAGADAAPRATRLELSPAQVVGSALAAVSSAFFASWAGTAGTLIGVAVGSVIATVGATTYTWWLRRTQEAVRRRAALVRQTTLAANGLPRTVSIGPLRRRDGDPAATRQQDALAHDARSARDAEDARDLQDDASGGRWAWPWKKVLLTSVAVMVLATAVITGFETLTGRTFASYTGNGGSGSTVGNVLHGGSSTRPTSPATPEGTPASTPTPTPSTSTATPTPQDTATAPTPTPTVPTASASATQGPATPGSAPTSGTDGSGSSTALP